MAALDHIDWNGTKISRFVLGTAQLGMPYGIANSVGQPELEKAHKIVAMAWCLGVNVFDTAQAYGNSEVVLGSGLKALSLDTGGALVITKLSPEVDYMDVDAVRYAIEKSCQRLHMNRLWCLMFHLEKCLQDWEKGLWQVLSDIWSSGRVDHIGLSAYSVNVANVALGNPYIDVIQIPCNAWDRRMVLDGVPERAKQNGKLCLVRSVYLQGLLTLSSEQVHECLPKAASLSERWCQLAASFGGSPKDLALRYALSFGTPLVIGVEAVAQVTDNVKRMSLVPLTVDEVCHVDKTMGCITEDILAPVLW